MANEPVESILFDDQKIVAGHWQDLLIGRF
jgi:hypothetical protein